jgi:hypothetical protein
MITSLSEDVIEVWAELMIAILFCRMRAAKAQDWMIAWFSESCVGEV